MSMINACVDYADRNNHLSVEAPKNEWNLDRGLSIEPQ